MLTQAAGSENGWLDDIQCGTHLWYIQYIVWLHGIAT